MRNKKMRFGMLAGLLMAPVAAVVTVSADESIKEEALKQIDVTQQAVNVSNMTVASTTPIAAGEMSNRLIELLQLNEDTFILDVARYTEMLEETGIKGEPLGKLLTAKFKYLGVLKELKNEAAKLNAEIGLLKTTNPDTIIATKKYNEAFTALQNKFSTARQDLDAAKKATGLTPDDIKDAIGHLKQYEEGTLEQYVLTQVPNYTTLQKFVVDTMGPKQFIESDGNGLSISIGQANDVKLDFKNFPSMPTTNAADRKKFIDQYTALKLYIDTKFTPDQKKIVESHKLEDGRTVAQVVKQAGDDIASADKVTALIDAMKTTEFKSESTFSAQVKAINTAYDKLTARGKTLVPKYDDEVKISSKTVGDKTYNSGYMAADEAIEAIKALKPAATQEYREAVTDATKIADKVHEDYKGYIINMPKLEEYSASIGKAEKVEKSIDAFDTSSPTAGDIIAAREAYNALSATDKKVVLKDLLTKLQDWEKTAKDSIKVNDGVSKIKIENKKTFATNVEKAVEQFNSLGTAERQNLVDLRQRLALLAPLAKITGNYYALKLGTTPEYRKGVQDIYDALNGKKAILTNPTPVVNYSGRSEDVTELEKLYDALWQEIQVKHREVAAAKVVEGLITTAHGSSGTAQVTAIIAARTAYTDLDATAKKIVNNLKVLTDLEKNVSTPVKVVTQITEVDPLSSTFESKAKTAVAAFDKLTSGQKLFITTDVQNMVKDYKIMLAFIAQVKAIKVTNPAYRSEVDKAEARLAELKNLFVSSKKPALNESLESYKAQLKNLDDGITNADKVVKMITDLTGFIGEKFFKELSAIENAYAGLSANDKKLVTNYAVYKQLKKDSTAAAKVIDLINHSAIRNREVANPNYEKAMKAAITAYDKLTLGQKSYIYNASFMLDYVKIYDLVVLVNKINPKNKTYREDINAARVLYNQLSNRDKGIAAPLLLKIEGSESGATEVQKVIDLINDAVPGSENYTDKLSAARVAYDQLASINSAYQKLVTNYKLLQDREKSLSPVTSVIYEIKELELLMMRPFNDATDFAKKFRAAVNAYEKIPFENRQLVTNREVLLLTIYPAASTIEAIQNIKESSNTFGPDVLKAREMYDQLSSSDKALVSNYNMLLGYEQLVVGGNSVDAMIRDIATQTGPNYMQAIKGARAAYDQLTAGEKKAVSLYKQLQAYEKAVQNVLTAIDLIDALQFSTNLVSAYDKAQKALDKLTAEQRQMVSNLNKLSSVAPAIEVYKMIANLKPNAESYAGSVQAAYAAYNRLSNTEKQFVTNFAQLQEAKNNMDNLSAVIAKIKEIQPGSRNYAAQLQAALALYNALPASVRKLVTNYDVLRNAQSELDAVEKVRSLIGEIDSKSATFVQKIIAARAAYDKLTANQKRLVSNYFMLEDYERELGTMF